MKAMCYALDEHGEAVPVERLNDPRVLALFEPGDIEHAPRRVAISQVGDWQVSTVFLVFNHNWGSGPPVLWETMVFGPEPWSEWQARYTSRADAEAGHNAIVERLLHGEPPPD